MADLDAADLDDVPGVLPDVLRAQQRGAVRRRRHRPGRGASRWPRSTSARCPPRADIPPAPGRPAGRRAHRRTRWRLVLTEMPCRGHVVLGVPRPPASAARAFGGRRGAGRVLGPRAAARGCYRTGRRERTGPAPKAAYLGAGAGPARLAVDRLRHARAPGSTRRSWRAAYFEVLDERGDPAPRRPTPNWTGPGHAHRRLGAASFRGRVGRADQLGKHATLFGDAGGGRATGCRQMAGGDRRRTSREAAERVFAAEQPGHLGVPGRGRGRERRRRGRGYGRRDRTARPTGRRKGTDVTSPELAVRPAVCAQRPYVLPRGPQLTLAGGDVVAAHLPGQPMAWLGLVLGGGALAEPVCRRARRCSTGWPGPPPACCDEGTERYSARRVRRGGRVAGRALVGRRTAAGRARRCRLICRWPGRRSGGELLAEACGGRPSATTRGDRFLSDLVAAKQEHFARPGVRAPAVVARGALRRAVPADTGGCAGQARRRARRRPGRGGRARVPRRDWLRGTGTLLVAGDLDVIDLDGARLGGLRSTPAAPKPGRRRTRGAGERPGCGW